MAGCGGQFDQQQSDLIFQARVSYYVSLGERY